MLNINLWPYHENYGNGKIHISAISCIQQCCLHLCGPCFMGSRVCFTQHFFQKTLLWMKRTLCGWICSPIGHSQHISISQDRTFLVCTFVLLLKNQFPNSHTVIRTVVFTWLLKTLTVGLNIEDNSRGTNDKHSVGLKFKGQIYGVLKIDTWTLNPWSSAIET